MMNTIVVTGATGMIGAALIRAALRHNVRRIYAIVRPGSSKSDRLPQDERISMIPCSIDRYEQLPQMIKEPCDVFYHIAWSLTGPARNSDLREQIRNIQYTLDALAAAAALGCKKFVGAGSQAEYGRSIGKLGPEAPVNPIQPYGIAKYAAGKMAMEDAKKKGISCIWVRIFSVYGIGDKPTTMIASAIKKMLRGERTSFTEGRQLWDYLFSEDAGEAFRLVGEKAEGCRVYCLGSGRTQMLCQYIEAMRAVVNPEAEIGLGDLPYAPDAVMHLCADIEKLSSDTGFVPKTSFSEGVRQTLEWHQKEELKKV